MLIRKKRVVTILVLVQFLRAILLSVYDKNRGLNEGNK